MSINDPRVPEAGTLISIFSYIIGVITLQDAAFIASIVVSFFSFFLMIDKIWDQTNRKFRQFKNWKNRFKNRRKK